MDEHVCGWFKVAVPVPRSVDAIANEKKEKEKEQTHLVNVFAVELSAITTWNEAEFGRT